MSAPLLHVTGLQVNYGHIEAVKGIDLALHEGQITTLVGANGAGKSTTLLALSGLVKKAAGRVMLDGKDLSKMAPHTIVANGVVQVAEGRATLTTLTVQENLELGAYARRDKGNRAADLAHIYSLFPVLKDRANGLAGNLSGGEQQMLAIARGLMARPKLLMLDEPSWGIAPKFVTKVLEVIQQVNQTGVSILLVEQNLQKALSIAHYGYVIQTGRIVMQGKGQDLLNDDRVRKAYLGL